MSRPCRCIKATGGLHTIIRRNTTIILRNMKTCMFGKVKTRTGVHHEDATALSELHRFPSNKPPKISVDVNAA